jgi:hypothetical protein
MIVESRNSQTECQYPQLEIYEHPILTEREAEYFKNDKGELKNRSAVEGVIGGVIILIGLLLVGIFVLFTQSAFLLIFAFMCFFMGGGFVFNAVTVKGTTEERFQKGEIKAAELVIPNAYFIHYIYGIKRRSTLDGYRSVYKRCCTGTYDGKKHIICMSKGNPSSGLCATFRSVSGEDKIEAFSYIGKRCLAKLTYARGSLFEIEVFLDELM